MATKGKEHSFAKQFLLQGHSRPVKMVKYNKDGDMFFTCSHDKNIIAWDNEHAEKMGVYEGPSACKSLAVSKHTEYVIGAFSMEGIVIYEAMTGNKVFHFKLEGYKTEYIEFSHGDSELLLLNRKGSTTQIQLYNFSKLLDKEKKVTKVFNFEEEITQASYGYLNEKLYLSTTKGKVLIVDIDSEQVEVEEKVHPGNEIFSFTFSNDFSMLATCSKDGKCKLLHPETLEVLKIYDKEAPWRSAAFSPLFDMDEADKYHILIAGGQDAKDVTGTKEQTGGFEVRLFHIIFEELLAQTKGHFGPVHSVAMSPDGRGFVTASEDGTVRLQRFPLEYYEKF